MVQNAVKIFIPFDLSQWWVSSDDEIGDFVTISIEVDCRAPDRFFKDAVSISIVMRGEKSKADPARSCG